LLFHVPEPSPDAELVRLSSQGSPIQFHFEPPHPTGRPLDPVPEGMVVQWPDAGVFFVSAPIIVFSEGAKAEFVVSDEVAPRKISNLTFSHWASTVEVAFPTTGDDVGPRSTLTRPRASSAWASVQLEAGRIRT